MGKMLCPRCDSQISLISSPSNHTGYFISDSLLETLDYKAGYKEFDIYEWFEKVCQSANHCPYCGYVWSFENEMKTEKDYHLDDIKKPPKNWKPAPLIVLMCETPYCDDKGGSIRRSREAIDAYKSENGGVGFGCEICHKPYVEKT